MPSKNVLKVYESDGYYHLYNRGVAKQIIFHDDQDYKTFLSFLQIYLSPLISMPATPNTTTNHLPAPSRRLKNYHDDITILAYCLMPNHFHIFLKQKSHRGIDHFMRSFITKYVRYYNSHYNRVGPLFQGPYKAVRITNEYQFTYITKYIHRNPLDLPPYKDSPRRLREYKYSSYGNYLNLFHQSWVSTSDILSYFSRSKKSLSYENFVEGSDPDDISIISNLTIDLE